MGLFNLFKQNPKKQGFFGVKKESNKSKYGGSPYEGFSNRTTFEVVRSIEDERQNDEEEDYYVQKIKNGTINNGSEFKKFFKAEVAQTEIPWTKEELDNNVNWNEIYNYFKKDRSL